MSMEYKHKTQVLGIPVPGYGDKIWPEMELKKFQIIENMLLAAMRGNVNAVFDEGSFTVLRGEDGKYVVRLSATGGSPCARGNVGGAYFEAPSSVAWDGLVEGSAYFLYLRGSSDTFADPSAVRTIASTRRMLDGVSVLMAKVDLSGEVATLDAMPDGKVNVKDLAKHVEDWDNPHGYRTAQDELLVKRTLAFEDTAVLDFGAAKVPAKMVAAVLTAMSQQTRRVVDFKSAGPEGVVLEGGGNVSFVVVSRVSTGAMDGLVGDVAVGYCGGDPKANRPDLFVVRNSGAADIPMRALVICG